MMRRNVVAGVNPRGQRQRSYVSALLAIGLTATVPAFRVGIARAQQNTQAIDPVNVADQQTLPAAQTPPPAALPQAPALVSSSDTHSPATAPAAAASEPAVAEGPADSHAPATAPASEPASAPAAVPVRAAVASTAPAVPADGKAYPVTGIKIAYYKDHPGEPPVSELLDEPIKLGLVKDGYVSPRAGVPTMTMRLKDVGVGQPQKIYRSGIQAVYFQLVRALNERGIVGVFVVVNKDDIDARDNDVRPEGRTTLQFIVVTSSIKQVRTLATADNVPEGQRVDNPRYESIRAHSPLKAGRDDLLNKNALDDYVLRLNRQPGRRVDVAVSGTGQIGGVNLDYLVSENRPWYVYAQVSNTGTKQTNEWRERLGFVDNQLTGHDDILSLDYITAGFDKSQSTIGSYALPFFDFDRARYKVYGSWNEFTASDVGQSSQNFKGDQWTVGNELAWNIFQHRELFLDLVGGFRAEGITTTNDTTGSNGDATYYVPYVGLRLDRGSELATTTGSLTAVQYTTDASNHVQQAEIQGLGRTPVARDPLVLQGDLVQTLYLEPLISPESFASGRGTMANELYFRAHAQWAFDSRLFPQAEDVAGGLYSVRGYPESIIAGDSVFIVTGEYRLHIPRLFPVQPDPSKTPFLWDKSFRFAPQQPYGHPDWDLITRAFVDVGRVLYSEHAQYERDSTLVGTGVGIELQYKQNFNFRVDWGISMTDLKSADPTQRWNDGRSRFHFSATFLY